MPYRLWTHDEVDELCDLLSYNPTPMAIAKFMDWQDANPDRDGLERTPKQVRRKADQLRPKIPQIDRLSIRGWSKLLGISYGRIYRASTDRPPNGCTTDAAMTERYLKKLIRRKPYILSGIDLTPARNLFGDEFIDALNIPSEPWTVRVCNSKGEQFESISAAARHYGVNKCMISKAIRRYKVVGDCRWERAA